jgi:hypothetical protein
VAPIFGGEIRWTGTPVVRYATGNDAGTLVSLGDPLFTGNAPGTVTLTSDGLNWSLSLVQNPRQYIEVQISASTLKAEARAPQLPGSHEQTQRVQLQADFVISDTGPLGATMTASPSGSVLTMGKLKNTVGVIDSVKAVGTLSYAETALQNSDPSSSLFAAHRTWQFQQTDAGPAISTRPDPWDDEVGWKSDGTYRLTLEVDLRAMAVGNDLEESATATWGQKFIYQQGFLSFVDITVPEPSTGVLAAVAMAGLMVLRSTRRLGRQTRP